MSFRLKTIVGIALIEALLLGVLVWNSLIILHKSNEQALLNRARTATALSAIAVKDALLATDLATLDNFVSEILSNPGIIYARILNDSGMVLSEGSSRQLTPHVRDVDENLEDITDGIFDTAAPIVESGMTFGRLELGIAIEELRSIFHSARNRAFFIAGMEMFLVALFSYILGSYLTRQLGGLTKASEHIARGELGYQIPVRGRDELAQTATAFNRMSDRLATLYSELQRESARMAAVVESALDGIITINREGRIQEFNPAAEAMFGYRKHEIIGKPMADYLIPPALREAHRKGLRAYLETGQGVVIGKRIEVPALRADQIEFSIELTITAVHSGENPTFTAYLRDLTAIKAAEQERRRLAMAVQASADCIFITDPEGVIRYANPAFTTITGWTEEEITDKTPGILLKSGLMPESFYQGMWSVLKRGETWTGRILNRRKPTSDEAQGALFWVQATIAPIIEDSNQLQGYVAIERDITAEVRQEQHQIYERESAEIRAQVSQVLQTQQPLSESLKSALEHIVQVHDLAKHNKGCILLDRRVVDIHRILITHPSCRWRIDLPVRLLAYMYSVLAARPSKEQVIISETSTFLDNPRAQTWHGHYAVPIYHGEIPFGLLLLVSSSAPIEDPARLAMLEMIGQMLGLAIANHQAQLEMELARESAEEASKIKSQFLANMSHEIRTPMYGVLGMLELLSEASLSAPHREYLQAAQHSGQLLLNVINDILDFSRIEAGKFTLEDTDFDIGKIVEDCVTLLSERAWRKGVELLCFISDQVPRTARGDPGRFNQVLMNLIGNAVKFTERGEITVRVDANTEEENHIVLSCEVKDTGVGIPEEIQPHLFQPFTQADGSTSRRFGGSGLGLVISKQLVEKMGGHIELSSKPGEGSVFRFQISLTHPRQERQPLPWSVAGKRILIVDDNANNRLILSSYLNRWGIQCGNAADASEALQQLRTAFDARQPWQAAIIDWQMPGMDGLELARTIRNNPSLAGIRLLLLSSLGQPIEDIQNCGIDMHLHKPVRKSQLYDALLTLIGQPVPTDRKTESNEASTALGLRGHVLLVEDNEVGQQIGLTMLQRLGLTVELANNGHEAIAATAATPFDAVLMDCQMPDIDGFEATRTIRQREQLRGNGRRTPIIALTANAMQGDREACLEAGMDDYLAKPLAATTLVATLQRWLEKPPADLEDSSDAAPTAKISADKPASDADNEIRIDLDRLRELRELLGPELGLLVNTFENLGQSVAMELRSAAEASNLEGLVSGAHKLKGSCGNLGAEQLLELCRQLEENSRRGDASGAEAQVERITAMHQATCRELRRLIENL
jgi:PAS domain S-box-containing protein